MTANDETGALPVAAVMQAGSAMLQEQPCVIFTTPVNGIGPVPENMEDHLAFQVELEIEDTMHAAGPMWTDDEQRRECDGMVVVRAASREEAVAIAERDPMHRRGARSSRVRPWMINEGTVTIRLDFSSRNFTLN